MNRFCMSPLKQRLDDYAAQPCSGGSVPCIERTTTTELGLLFASSVLNPEDNVQEQLVADQLDDEHTQLQSKFAIPHVQRLQNIRALQPQRFVSTTHGELAGLHASATPAPIAMYGHTLTRPSAIGEPAASKRAVPGASPGMDCGGWKSMPSNSFFRNALAHPVSVTANIIHETSWHRPVRES